MDEVQQLGMRSLGKRDEQGKGVGENRPGVGNEDRPGGDGGGTEECEGRGRECTSRCPASSRETTRGENPTRQE